MHAEHLKQQQKLGHTPFFCAVRIRPADDIGPPDSFPTPFLTKSFQKIVVVLRIAVYLTPV